MFRSPVFIFSEQFLKIRHRSKIVIVKQYRSEAIDTLTSNGGTRKFNPIITAAAGKIRLELTMARPFTFDAPNLQPMHIGITSMGRKTFKRTIVKCPLFPL
jgi:hypothetical protein